MRILPLILVLLLTACAAPIDLPFEIPGLNPATEEPAPLPSATPTLEPGVTPSATPTATITPRPTRQSPYPIYAGTMMPAFGFEPLTASESFRLKPALVIPRPQVWQIHQTPNRQKLFVSTSNGLYVLKAGAGEDSHWIDLFTVSQPCATCLSANADGSRFATLTRNAGLWEVQVFDVENGRAVSRFTQTYASSYRHIPNEGLVALSPDGRFLIHTAGENLLEVVDLNASVTAFRFSEPANGATFSPDGNTLVIRQDNELIFWNTADWRNPLTLVVALKGEVWNFAFSPDARSFVVLQANLLRLFNLADLKLTRQIVIFPTSSTPREWFLDFSQTQTLRAQSLRGKQLESFDWNLASGERTAYETRPARPIHPLLDITNTTPPELPSTDNLQLGNYLVFYFLSNDQLLVNEEHSACWMTLTTGDIQCKKDPVNRLFATGGAAYREIRAKYSTTIRAWTGEVILETDPRPLAGITRGTEFLIMDIRQTTTDIYPQRFQLPAISLPGPFIGFAENINRVAVATLKEPGVTAITGFEKLGRKILYQKMAAYIVPQIVMNARGTVYYLQEDTNRSVVSLRAIDEKTFRMYSIGEIRVDARVRTFTQSPAGLFALGMQDGSVVLVSPEGQIQSTLQAMHSPITHLAISNDERYLAVAGAEGIRIYAILP